MTQTATKERPSFASIEEEIEWHRDNGSNLLIPNTRLEASEFFRPVIDQITLSIEDGDAYERKDAKGNTKYALSLQGLNRLAMCAGVDWDPRETRRIDNMADKNYIIFQARGGICKADGSSVWQSAAYEFDLEIIREEIEEQARARAKNYKKSQKEKESYIQYVTERDFRQKRRHKLALAESGAKARVLRTLLGIKGLYTRQELTRPFVVIRYIFIPPVDDPVVRRQVTAIGMGSISRIYGNALPPQQDYIDIPTMQEPARNTEEPEQPAANPQSEPNKPDKPDKPNSASHRPVQTPVQNGLFSEPENQPENQPEDQPENQPENQPEDQPEDQPENQAGEDDELGIMPIEDDLWAVATRSEKVTEVRRIAAYTGYDLKAFEERAKAELKDLSDDQIDKLFKNLCGLIKEQA